MPDHNRRATNFKTALLFDRAQATSYGSQDTVREVTRLSNPKADVRPDHGSLPSASVLDWLRDTWPRSRINSFPTFLHPPFGLLSSSFASLHSLQQPCQPILANHRCNLTQPSRNRSNPPFPCFLLISFVSPCLPPLKSLRSHFLHVPANTVCNDRSSPNE